MNQQQIQNKQKVTFWQLILGFWAMFAFNYATAAGGLQEATDQVNEIKTWAYGFLGVGVFVYLIYNVIMALLDRKQWADVLVAVGYVALAGGIIVVGEWAWSIWGS
jgi:hypothetical protein